MTVSYHPEARGEYEDADAYYESCSPGLGEQFIESVTEAVSRIATAPLLFPVLEQDVRRCLTHTFPYGILYTVEVDSILILAVMHLSRRPGYWKDRL